jgi:hypothetical protein
MTAAVACTKCGALDVKYCACKPDFSFQRLGEPITVHPIPQDAYENIQRDIQKAQAEARRAERLEVASRVLVETLGRDEALEPSEDWVKISLGWADTLIAAVDAKP